MEYLAGIVLYNPEIKRLMDNINNLILEFDIILVDNASSNIQDINRYLSSNKKVVLIRNKVNKGIAAALNQIMEYGEQHQYNWVLTMDQDSIFPNNGLEIYSRYLQSQVAVLTCRVIDTNNPVNEENGLKSKELLTEKVSRCITSGSMNSVKVWREIDGFDEQMFIDYVDFEYCIRVKKNGYDILKCNEVELKHQLGNLEIKNILGKKIYVTNHPPKRYYFLFRNLVYTKHKHSSDISGFYIVYKVVVYVCKILLFEQSKIDKFKNIYRGITDGLRMETQ